MEGCCFSVWIDALPHILFHHALDSNGYNGLNMTDCCLSCFCTRQYAAIGLNHVFHTASKSKHVTLLLLMVLDPGITQHFLCGE